MVINKHTRLGVVVFALLFLQTVIFSAVAMKASGLWNKLDSGHEEAELGDINVSGISLAGLTRAEAAAKLRERTEKFLALPIELSVDGTAFVLDKQNLGVSYDVAGTIEAAAQQSREISGVRGLWNKLTFHEPIHTVPMKVTYNRIELVSQIETIAKKMDREAASATLRVDGSQARLVPDVVGYRVDVDQALTVVETALQEARPGTVIPLAVNKRMPEITGETLSGSLSAIGDQSVSVPAADADRAGNLKRIVERLNGQVVLPGQVFSFNEATGPYTQEKGYRLFLYREEQIPDTVGGAAAQAASVLYGAAMKANLTVIERHSNKRPIAQVPLGTDALVNGAELDLRLLNPGKHAAYIYAALENNQLRIALFGDKGEGSEFTLETKMADTYRPDTLVRSDPKLPSGAERIVRVGSQGQRVKMYKLYKQTGVKELVADTVYPPQPTIIAVGPKIEGKDKPRAQKENGQPTQPDANAQPQEASPSDDGMPPDIDPIHVTPDQGGETGTTAVEDNNGFIILH